MGSEWKNGWTCIRILKLKFLINKIVSQQVLINSFIIKTRLSEEKDSTFIRKLK